MEQLMSVLIQTPMVPHARLIINLIENKMNKLEKFKGTLFVKEIESEQLKLIKGGKAMLSGVTLSGCVQTSKDVDDCGDTDTDCPPA